MTAVLHARGLGKKYGRRWALTDCTVEVPPARVVGLVGPNGAGKSTFLNLAVGMLTPSAGEIEVLGERPTGRTAVRARVGFVGQDTPTYAGMRVRDHLRLGAALNPRWDATLAEERIRRLGLDPAQKAGRLSGGQRAQLALTLALSKRPDLLVLDEPVASLDPLARRAFLDETVAASMATGTAVVLSTHLVADLAHTCTHVVVAAKGRIRLAAALASVCSTAAELERVVLDELGRATDDGQANR